MIFWRFRAATQVYIIQKVAPRNTMADVYIYMAVNKIIIIIINGNPEAGCMPLFPSEVDNFNTNINTN